MTLNGEHIWPFVYVGKHQSGSITYSKSFVVRYRGEVDKVNESHVYCKCEACGMCDTEWFKNKN